MKSNSPRSSSYKLRTIKVMERLKSQSYKQFLDKLSPTEREVFECRLQGLTFDAIGNQINRSSERARQHLIRACRQLTYWVARENRKPVLVIAKLHVFPPQSNPNFDPNLKDDMWAPKWSKE